MLWEKKNLNGKKDLMHCFFWGSDMCEIFLQIIVWADFWFLYNNLLEQLFFLQNFSFTVNLKVIYFVIILLYYAWGTACHDLTKYFPRRSSSWLHHCFSRCWSNYSWTSWNWRWSCFWWTRFITCSSWSNFGLQI